MCLSLQHKEPWCWTFIFFLQSSASGSWAYGLVVWSLNPKTPGVKGFFFFFRAINNLGVLFVCLFAHFWVSKDRNLKFQIHCFLCQTCPIVRCTSPTSITPTPIFLPPPPSPGDTEDRTQSFGMLDKHPAANLHPSFVSLPTAVPRLEPRDLCMEGDEFFNHWASPSTRFDFYQNVLQQRLFSHPTIHFPRAPTIGTRWDFK